MVIWMQHANHGKHPAQAVEVDGLKKQGWTLCPPKTRTKPEPETFAAVEASVTVAESTAFSDAKAAADREAGISVSTIDELNAAGKTIAAQEKRQTLGLKK